MCADIFIKTPYIRKQYDKKIIHTNHTLEKTLINIHGNFELLV